MVAAAIVMVDEPVPVTVDGLKLGVTPAGSPLVVKDTVGLGSLPGTTLIVKFALFPPRTDAALEGVRIRKGCNMEASPPWLSVS